MSAATDLRSTVSTVHMVGHYMHISFVHPLTSNMTCNIFLCAPHFAYATFFSTLCVITTFKLTNFSQKIAFFTFQEMKCPENLPIFLHNCSILNHRKSSFFALGWVNPEVVKWVCLLQTQNSLQRRPVGPKRVDSRPGPPFLKSRSAPIPM